MSDKAYDVLMQNQFHDILPATSIKIAADQAISENTKVIKDINDTIKETFNSNITIQDNLVTLINPNGIKTSKTQVLDGKYNLEGYLNQTVNILGNDKTFVEVSLDSYETKVFELSNKGTKNKEGFVLNKDVDRVNTISTELYNVEFDNNMYITSLFDKRENRETVQGAFNRFNMGQHVPLLWDNWDFDKDYTFKMEDVNNLISSKVVSNGELVLVIENIYQLTKESILTQNMVFYKNEVRIDFFTKIDWNSTYLVLKTYFDTNIIAPNFKSEVQFGYETRSTLNNYSHEQAQFEVVNHKWTNLGESDYQVSILNDSSYGISVKDRVMGLTLLTSGTRPDPTASRGINYMNYSIVLNNNSFNVLDTISPSYLLNNPIMVVEGRLDENVFAKVDNSKVIIETIKIGENEGIVLRLYESTFNHVNTNLVLNDTYTIYETNMLEEEKVLLGNSNSISLNFKPFEIKTLLLIK